MIKVNLRMIRLDLPNQAPQQHYRRDVAYIDASRVDTVTAVTDRNRENHNVPDEINCCVRYMDPVLGYRLLYLADKAEEIVHKRRRELRGEDSEASEFEIR